MNDAQINQNGVQEAPSDQAPSTEDPIDELKRAYQERIREIETHLTIIQATRKDPEVQDSFDDAKMQLENLKLRLDSLIELLKHEI